MFSLYLVTNTYIRKYHHYVNSSSSGTLCNHRFLLLLNPFCFIGLITSGRSICYIYNTHSIATDGYKKVKTTCRGEPCYKLGVTDLRIEEERRDGVRKKSVLEVRVRIKNCSNLYVYSITKLLFLHNHTYKEIILKFPPPPPSVDCCHDMFHFSASHFFKALHFDIS